MKTDQSPQDMSSGAFDEAERLVAAARGDLQRGQMGDAENKCQEALDHVPTHREALYLLAVIQRISRRPLDSLANVTRLIEADPGNGRAYQERGHSLLALGRTEEALGAFQDAVAYNAGLLASWRILADMHERAGRTEAARYARAQCAYLESLPEELQAVVRLVQENRLGMAENQCRAFLQRHGHHTEAMRLLAEIGTKFNSYEEAEFLLESCLVLEPQNTNAHFDYVNLLQKRQKFGEALDQARALRDKAPENGQFDLLYANQSLAVGEFDEALAIYRRHIAKMPDNPTLHLSVGHALKTIGNQAEAIAAYREAYRVRPEFGDAYWSLANLKTYRFEPDEIRQMRAFESRPTTGLVDRYHLCFALGKALEDRGDYADSFAYYERGNRLKRDELGYDWRRITAEVALQKQHCGAELFERFTGAGCQSADPIFILGLPRAGSTLLEQILSSHSQVEGTLELPNILALSHQIDGRRRIGDEANYPGNLVDLSADQLTEFGEAFIRDTRVHRKQGKAFFIDKMPNNFRHIALIHLILPNAKIIDARRGAMGCCFSGFKQLFAEGQEFTYGLEEIGHYYRDYVDLMDHWDNVLPGKVLRVRYEDVVADLETQVRRLLDFCGLPFEAACLEFHHTERAVRTASSEQVRQPIYKTGVDQWENFSDYLDPLRGVLGPELVAT
ncbi:sulfotransferase [Novosphingobium aquiterrae]|uniref:Sulfotransferase n=1 Tax=Novosphingobium aquiterrae TaxID=624388 RepID=A0ABV6PLF8_9SPHN